jgi:hypothetical protein
MFSITTYSLAEGNPSKYFAPVDSHYVICGHNSTSGSTALIGRGKPYLSFSADYASPFDSSECVANCDSCSRSVGGYCVPYFNGPKACKEVVAVKDQFEAAFESALESNAFGR